MDTSLTPEDPIGFKPKQPESYGGKRDYLSVSTWIFKMEQYFHLVGMFKPGMLATDASRIMFASTFLVESAAIWWFTLAQTNTTPDTWTKFCDAIRSEFVPADYLRCGRDRLRKLKQTKSVSRYLAEFRNIILTLSDITEGEQLDKFVQGLKQEIRLEVLKSTASTFEEVSRIALRIDSAMWNSRDVKYGSSSTTDNGVTPMEIGNLEKYKNLKPNSQRKKDMENNACFVCHTTGCRPWKHKKETNNVEAQDENCDYSNSASSDSEN